MDGLLTRASWLLVAFVFGVMVTISYYRVPVLWQKAQQLGHVQTVVVPALIKAIPAGTSAKHETARTETSCIPIHPPAE